MLKDRLFIAVVIGGLFYLAGQYLASQPLREGQQDKAERQITVTGRGEVTAKPDIARVMLGVQTGVHPTAEAALTALAESFENVVAALQAAGVAEDDIATSNLSTQPLYDFNNGRQTLRGYEANETVRVTVRDLGQAGTIAARATEAGANNLGGIQFEIDEPQKLQLEAQQKAIADAREQADQLAESLNVKLGKLTSFSSSGEGGPPVPYFAREAALGQGGDAAVSAPPVPEGTQDVVMTVTVSYEIK
ncbi:MAG TPA: SIMPL domain-containing protein [Candidatus Andersenbacteria bacterium]|nr:SIMPL domain-containing protein [Candidatus Andersenbacteria bacterium]